MATNAERPSKVITRTEAYIRRIVDAAPPLTAEQRTRLAALLAPAAQQGSTDSPTSPRRSA